MTHITFRVLSKTDPYLHWALLKYILFIGIHTQLLCVTRGFGYHSPPTNAAVAGPSLEKPEIIE